MIKNLETSILVKKQNKNPRHQYPRVSFDIPKTILGGHSVGREISCQGLCPLMIIPTQSPLGQSMPPAHTPRPSVNSERQWWTQNQQWLFHVTGSFIHGQHPRNKNRRTICTLSIVTKAWMSLRTDLGRLVATVAVLTSSGDLNRSRPAAKAEMLPQAEF